MHIIIIGGGLGGLCLAQGLKKEGISFSIFERDVSKDARRQGYRLRINLPVDGVNGKVKVRSEGMNQLRGIGGEGSGSDVHTVDRATLRDVLLRELENTVQFGKEFVHYEEKGDKVVAHFEDGTSVEGDLLVGADGMYSRVRRQYLPDFNPVHTQGRAIYGKTQITDKFLQRFNKDASEWMTIISDENQVHLFLEFITFPRDPAEISPHLVSVKDYVYWVMISGSSNYPLSDEEFFSLDSKGAAALSRKMIEDWDPSLRAVIELQQDETASVVRVTTITGPEKWKPTIVTLLGDAVHAMPPTGGSGANTALRDAQILVGVLKKSGINGIGEYEAQMWRYAHEAVMRSIGALKHTFGISMTNQKPLPYRQN